ncbi:hypothetical protein BLA29_014532, partial [Euroglyphus maynei]
MFFKIIFQVKKVANLRLGVWRDLKKVAKLARLVLPLLVEPKVEKPQKLEVLPVSRKGVPRVLHSKLQKLQNPEVVYS